MSKKMSELTASDVEWFKISQYPLEALTALPLTEWIQIVSDRLALQRFIEANRRAEALRRFEPLKTNPFATLGAGQGNISKAHHTDTPSITLLRVSRLRAMSSIANSLALAGEDCFDSVTPSESSGGLSKWAHLSVNCWATKTQLRSDFDLWLRRMGRLREPAANRQYTKVVKQWAKSLYLPYFDLILFARARDAVIPRTVLQERLGLKKSAGATDPLKTAERALEVFTFETVQAMRLQCFDRG